jgi:hypothetical protein
MLGVFVRLFGIIGALQILNLWLGLYSAPGKWPWTYFFLLVLMLIFAFHHYGRSLGLDAIMMRRVGEGARSAEPSSRAQAEPASRRNQAAAQDALLPVIALRKPSQDAPVPA